jgi:large subunit ribosomal protein L30
MAMRPDGVARVWTPAPAQDRSMADEKKTLKITLLKSTIGFNEKQGKVVESLGLRRIRHSVTLPDTPAVRGMILKVRHLVAVEGN